MSEDHVNGKNLDSTIEESLSVWEAIWIEKCDSTNDITDNKTVKCIA